MLIHIITYVYIMYKFPKKLFFTRDYPVPYFRFRKRSR
jgi:hypothetical protein